VCDITWCMRKQTHSLLGTCSTPRGVHAFECLLRNIFQQGIHELEVAMTRSAEALISALGA